MLENITSLELSVPGEEGQVMEDEKPITEDGYLVEKVKNQEELDLLTKNLQVKEEALQKLLSTSSDQHLLPEEDTIEDQSSIRLLELEYQLQQTQNERDNALKQLQTRIQSTEKQLAAKDGQRDTKSKKQITEQ